MEVAVSAEQGVMLALIKSHHQGPFTLATAVPQGSALKGAHGVARGVFWGSFSRVPRMHCFPGFPLKGGIKGDIKGGLKGGHQGRLMGPSAQLLTNAASRTVINQPKMPRSRLARRTCAIPL